MKTKEELIAGFDPNAAASADAGLFGLPFTAEQSDIVVIPVPWEVTVSFRSGTGRGPASIEEASSQIDLYHHDYPELWKLGIYMDKCPDDLILLGEKARHDAGTLIEAIEQGEDIMADPALAERQAWVNEACAMMNTWVMERAAFWKNQGKMVGLVGGDHSIPLGYMQLQGKHHANFGILHIDAHLDLRVAYEGFVFSHASIFYNTLESVPQVSRLVQVGIRDYCEQENNYVKANPDRIAVYFDRENRKRMYQGENWHQLCLEIVGKLPQKVHISVDIDGLDPKLCPNTGTPVAGGMEYEELMHLLNVLKSSGKEIIGFDLCEVAPGEDGWDGNVGARVLFQLCGTMAG
ncbi:MAG: agmatinase family protein [Bacteroidales bacterium]|nr:agmatinase family protein [Bacteroidales bacterium]MBK9358428.1 agmatinase family protein [Bacteroidales bacterium]